MCHTALPASPRRFPYPALKLHGMVSQGRGVTKEQLFRPDMLAGGGGGGSRGKRGKMGTPWVGRRAQGQGRELKGAGRKVGGSVWTSS